MLIFVEKFILPILVAIVMLFVTNVYKMEWHQRISATLGMAFTAYFLATMLTASKQSRPTVDTTTSQPSLAGKSRVSIPGFGEIDPLNPPAATPDRIRIIFAGRTGGDGAETMQYILELPGGFQVNPGLACTIQNFAGFNGV